MKPAHIISDELFEEAMMQIQAGNEFVAYNSTQYLLDKGDMVFFPTRRMRRNMLSTITVTMTVTTPFVCVRSWSCMTILKWCRHSLNIRDYYHNLK